MSEPSVEVTENSLQKDRESLKKLWVSADVGWLRDYFKEVLRWNKRVREHRPSTVDSLGSQERIVKPGDFLVATGSSEKLRLFSEIIQEQGGSAQSAAFIGDQWKSDAKEEARYFGISLFPLTVAESKLFQLKTHIFKEGKAAIATDSVVVGPRGRIMEKPKSPKDLEKVLRALSGKKIGVLVGVCMLVPLKKGMIAPGLSEGAEIVFKLRDLTDEEIADYVKEKERSAMEVAGGIDFSSELGQNLIDKFSALKVSPLKKTIYERFCQEKGIAREPVLVDPANIGILADYFGGAPKGIISILMKQSKDLQEQVEIV